jgi:hypothetical protein
VAAARGCEQYSICAMLGNDWRRRIHNDGVVPGRFTIEHRNRGTRYMVSNRFRFRRDQQHGLFECAAQTPESSFGSFGSTGTIVIGNNTGVGNSMTADIAEVVFWTSEATLAADISNLITYFTNKWF